MPVSIGIFTARQSLDNIRLADEAMRRCCRITYLPYSSMSELGSLYLKNIRKFDGILFSGPIPKDYILENVSSITKPYRCLDLTDRDYYLAIARLFAGHPGLDFSRVYFDAALDREVLKNVFGEDHLPSIPAGHTPSEHRRFLRSPIYERSMDVYRSLWRQKKFDILVTRFTNLADSLEAEHIPYLLLKPSPASVLERFYALLGDIREALLQNSLAACCLVELPKDRRTPEDQELLSRALLQVNDALGGRMLIRQNEFCFEAAASSMEARELTEGCTSCLLSDRLRGLLPFSPLIGWGVGFGMVTAYKNAKRALLACEKDRSHFTYLVTENQEIAGPLNGNRALTYGLRPDARIFSLAKSLGVAPVNLEKLLFLQKTRGMCEFTSGDLVYFLDITPRSASRILSRLSAGGLARPVRSVNLSGAGRPSTVYELELSELLS